MLCKFRVGHLSQSFAIGGIALINYEDTYSLEQLPSVDAQSTYQGMETNASWRTAAANRIAQYRQSDLTVQVVDLNGTPIPNANIVVEQQSHAFDFSNSEKGKFMLLQDYQEDLVRFFNMLTFENDLIYSSWTNPQAYHVSKPDELCEAMDWIASNALKLRWHTALWPYSANLPPMPDAPTLENNIKSFVDEVLQYPCISGRIYEIDLLNEPALNRTIENALWL